MNDSAKFVASRSDLIHADSWRNPYRLAARRLQTVVGELAGLADLPSGTRLLDYGCADMPYRHLCPPNIEYVGADLAGNPGAALELRADGTVPCPDSSFDLALSTQVLEHVDDPSLYLAECQRVLKPGGALILTTHGIMHYHPDPVDYWRWTSAGLTKVVRDAGLEVVELQGIMGMAAAAIQLFQMSSTMHLPARLRSPYVAALQWLATVADRRTSAESRRQDSLVLALRAEKLA